LAKPSVNAACGKRQKRRENYPCFFRRHFLLLFFDQLAAPS